MSAVVFGTMLVRSNGNNQVIFGFEGTPIGTTYAGPVPVLMARAAELATGTFAGTKEVCLLCAHLDTFFAVHPGDALEFRAWVVPSRKYPLGVDVQVDVLRDARKGRCVASRGVFQFGTANRRDLAALENSTPEPSAFRTPG